MGITQLINRSTLQQIEETTEKILNATSMMEPPVDYNRILTSEKLKYLTFTGQHPCFKDFSRELGKEKANKLRGVLIVAEKQMFIRDEGYTKRTNYTFGHELAHWCLDWHRELLYYCNEFDLSFKARKQLEIEANYFSCNLGFMNGRFNRELADCQLSISSIQYLSDRYNLSVEASLRAGVQGEERPCALIVMEPEKNEKGYSLRTKYSFQSESFTSFAGKVNYLEIFNPDHPMSKIMNDTIANIKRHYNFNSTINRKGNKKEVNVEVWINNYNAFALLTPKQ